MDLPKKIVVRRSQMKNFLETNLKLEINRRDSRYSLA